MDKNSEKTAQNITQEKIDKMRALVLDKAKCKEIAQKLCAYISKKS